MLDTARFIFSCQPTNGERIQLLRPRMLDEYTLPNVGMIMYGFFWIKYGLWLRERDITPSEQSELLLWTEYPGDGILIVEFWLSYKLVDLRKGGYATIRGGF